MESMAITALVEARVLQDSYYAIAEPFGDCHGAPLCFPTCLQDSHMLQMENDLFACLLRGTVVAETFSKRHM